MRSFTIIGGNMLNQIIKIALYSVVLSVFLSTGFTKNHNNNDSLQRTSIFIGKYVGQPRGYWHDSAFNLYLSYQSDKNILSYMPNIILGRYRYDGHSFHRDNVTAPQRGQSPFGVVGGMIFISLLSPLKVTHL